MTDHHFGRRSSALSAFMSRARGEMVTETTTALHTSSSNRQFYSNASNTTEENINGRNLEGGSGGGSGGVGDTDTSFLNMLSQRIINTRTGPPLSITHDHQSAEGVRGSFSQPYARGLQYPSPAPGGAGELHNDHNRQQVHPQEVARTMYDANSAEIDIYKPYYAIAQGEGGGGGKGVVGRERGSNYQATDSVASVYRAIRDRNGKGYWGGSVQSRAAIRGGSGTVGGVSPITPITFRRSAPTSFNNAAYSHNSVRTANFFPQGGALPEEEVDSTEGGNDHYRDGEVADQRVSHLGSGGRSTSGPYDTPATTPLQIARDTTAAHQHIAEMYAASATRNRRASNASSAISGGGNHYTNAGRGASGLNHSTIVSRTSSGGVQRRGSSDGLSVYEQALQSITVHGGDTQRAYRGKKSGTTIAAGRAHTPNNHTPSGQRARLVREVGGQDQLRLATPTLLSMIDASGQLHYNTYKTDPRTWERVSSFVEAERRSRTQHQQQPATQGQLMMSPEDRWKKQLRDETRRDAQDGVWHTDRFQPSPRKSPGLQRLPLEPKRRGLYFEDVENARGKLPFDPCACTKYSPRVGGEDGDGYGDIVTAGPHRTVMGDGEEPGNYSPPRPEVSGGEWGPHAGYTSEYQAQQPPSAEEAALGAHVGSRSHSVLDHHASHYVHDHCLHDCATAAPSLSAGGIIPYIQPAHVIASRQALLEIELLIEREKSGRTSLWAAFEEKVVDFSVLFYHTKPQATNTHSHPQTNINIPHVQISTKLVSDVGLERTRQSSGSHTRVDDDGEYLKSLDPINVASAPAEQEDTYAQKHISPPSHYRPGFGPEQHFPTAARPEWRSPSPPHPGESFPPLSSPKRSAPAPSLEQQVREGLFRVHQSRSSYQHVSNTLRSASADTAPPGTPNRDGSEMPSSLPPPPPPMDMYQKMLEREKSFATEKQQWGEVYGEMKKALRSMADKNTELVRQASSSQPTSRSYSRNVSPNRDASLTTTDIGVQQRSLSPDGSLKTTLRADFSPPSAYYDEY